MYLNSPTRRRSVVHPSADLPPLYVVPRQRQRQPLLDVFFSEASSASGEGLVADAASLEDASAFVPSPLTGYLRLLCERRRARRRSRFHPRPLPLPPAPPVPTPRGEAPALPTRKVTAAAAALAVGQQQLSPSELRTLQEQRLLTLVGGVSADGLGAGGASTLSLLNSEASSWGADRTSAAFCETSSLVPLAEKALQRWASLVVAEDSRPLESALAAEKAACAVSALQREDLCFWNELADRLFDDRASLPVETIARLLRLMASRFSPASSAEPAFFLSHLCIERQASAADAPAVSRLRSCRPVRASLLAALCREFIDDAHRLSPAAACDLAAVMAAANCASLELCQLLYHRSVKTWMQSEAQVQQQREAAERAAQRGVTQIFSEEASSLGRFSSQEFAVFVSALVHQTLALQTLLHRRAPSQPRRLLFPLSPFLEAAASFVRELRPQTDGPQFLAALESLAALVVESPLSDAASPSVRRAAQGLLAASDFFLSSLSATDALTGRLSGCAEQRAFQVARTCARAAALTRFVSEGCQAQELVAGVSTLKRLLQEVATQLQACVPEREHGGQREEREAFAMQQPQQPRLVQDFRLPLFRQPKLADLHVAAAAGEAACAVANIRELQSGPASLSPPSEGRSDADAQGDRGGRAETLEEASRALASAVIERVGSAGVAKAIPTASLPDTLCVILEEVSCADGAEVHAEKKRRAAQVGVSEPGEARTD